jgi:hypothetical protein
MASPGRTKLLLSQRKPSVFGVQAPPAKASKACTPAIYFSCEINRLIQQHWVFTLSGTVACFQQLGIDIQYGQHKQ